MGAVLGTAVAVAATLQTAFSSSRKLGVLARREAEVGRLRGLAGRWRGEEAYLGGLGGAGRRVPVDLEEAARRAFHRVGAGEIRVLPARRVAEGWRAREARVVFPAILYRDLSVFLDEVTGMPPPWRVKELTLVAGERPGRGEARLLLEALEGGEGEEGVEGGEAGVDGVEGGGGGGGGGGG